MSQYTDYYNLKKPVSSENYDIDVANTNNTIIDTVLHSKVDKKANKDLSTNDFTNEYKKKIDSMQTLYRFKGTVDNINDLSRINNCNIGDVYRCKEDMNNYVWNKTEWINIGQDSDFTNILNKLEQLKTEFYKGTNIVAETIEGIGKIHKLFGNVEEIGTTSTMHIISKKGEKTSSKTITCKPLYCIKNNEGNIIAQDYIDFDRQKIVRQCGYITFDGSDDENWVADTRNNRFFIAKPIDCLRSEIGNCTSICNKYQINETETVDKSYNIGASIYVKDLSCSDLSSFKQSLGSNPMILIVALNTSYEEDIDCTCEITQYEEETTIYNTEGAELEVELTNNKAMSSVNKSIANLQEKNMKQENYKLLGSSNNTDITITLRDSKLSDYKFLVVDSGYADYRSITTIPVCVFKSFASNKRQCNQYVKTYNGFGMTSISYINDTSLKINGAVITESTGTDTVTYVYGIK